MQVTVYRLICKETVEEKILQRASQKNTVQQLVMTGGHVQGDLVAPEDVVSILFDEAEQRIRGLPLQVTKLPIEMVYMFIYFFEFLQLACLVG